MSVIVVVNTDFLWLLEIVDRRMHSRREYRVAFIAHNRVAHDDLRQDQVLVSIFVGGGVPIRVSTFSSERQIDVCGKVRPNAEHGTIVAHRAAVESIVDDRLDGFFFGPMPKIPQVVGIFIRPCLYSRLLLILGYHEPLGLECCVLVQILDSVDLMHMPVTGIFFPRKGVSEFELDLLPLSRTCGHRSVEWGVRGPVLGGVLLQRDETGLAVCQDFLCHFLPLLSSSFLLHIDPLPLPSLCLLTLPFFQLQFNLFFAFFGIDRFLFLDSTRLALDATGLALLDPNGLVLLGVHRGRDGIVLLVSVVGLSRRNARCNAGILMI